jgi:hypothetical protein
VKWQGPWSWPSNAEVKNDWSCTAISPSMLHGVYRNNVIFFTSSSQTFCSTIPKSRMTLDLRPKLHQYVNMVVVMCVGGREWHV